MKKIIVLVIMLVVQSQAFAEAECSGRNAKIINSNYDLVSRKLSDSSTIKTADKLVAAINKRKLLVEQSREEKDKLVKKLAAKGLAGFKEIESKVETYEEVIAYLEKGIKKLKKVKKMIARTEKLQDSFISACHNDKNVAKMVGMNSNINYYAKSKEVNNKTRTYKKVISTIEDEISEWASISIAVIYSE